MNRRGSTWSLVRCPCCTAGGGRLAPSAVLPVGPVRRRTIRRAGGGRRLLQARVRCLRCDWTWWTTNRVQVRLAAALTAAPGGQSPNEN